MNPNRLVLLGVIASLAVPPLAAETLIDQLYGIRQYELADAYWSAGKKFSDLGQPDRGAEFQAQAKRLFPGFVPGQAPKLQAGAPVVPVSNPQVPDTSVVREVNLQGQKVAGLQFQKLLRGYLTGSAATIASVLGPSLEVQGRPVQLSTPTIATFLEDHPAEAGAPDELFQTDTLEVVDGPGNQVLVKVTALPSDALASLLPFWRTSQTYTFDRVGDTWKLVAVEGQ